MQAERSDIFAKPNPYKLLYAFEANRNNWRKAASYMFRYSVRLKKEANSNGNHQDSSVLQERLHALSAAINALQQVDHAYAWIESQYGNDLSNYQGSPNKKPRNVSAENCNFCSIISVRFHCPHHFENDMKDDVKLLFFQLLVVLPLSLQQSTIRLTLICWRRSTL